MSSDHQAPFQAAFQHADRFRRSIQDRSPLPDGDFPSLMAAFDGPTPEVGSDSSTVIESLVRAAEPGLMGTAGRRFFGWVIGASHPAGVAADWLTSAWGQNSGNYPVSPAAAVAEQVATGWLLDLLRLPSEASVGFVSGATLANFVGLVAARGHVLRKVDWDVEADGLFGAPPVAVFIGAEAHATVFSSLRLMGFGDRRVIQVESDGEGRMNLPNLAVALNNHSGPAIVIAQAGHINSGAFDPVGAIADLAHEHEAWVHVDGAFGLWARACPSRASLAEGVEKADSWATDGHKWLQTPYDSGYAIVRDPEAHRRAMTIAASYLSSSSDGIRDPAQYVPELSRRARGFATWAVIKALGKQGIASMVDRHCNLARLFARLLAEEPGVRIHNDVVLNQVVVSFGPSDSEEERDHWTREVIAALQEDGTCFAAGTQWQERWMLRLSVISGPTTEADIRASADAIIKIWRRVQDA